jgi:hypothetical protein
MSYQEDKKYVDDHFAEISEEIETKYFVKVKSLRHFGSHSNHGIYLAVIMDESFPVWISMKMYGDLRQYHLSGGYPPQDFWTDYFRANESWIKKIAQLLYRRKHNGYPQEIVGIAPDEFMKLKLTLANGSTEYYDYREWFIPNIEYIMSYEKFVEKFNESGKNSNLLAEKYRMQKVAALEVPDLASKYSIVISVGEIEGKSLLIEHEKYQGFRKTTNRFVKHPANSDIPVQAHYHVYPKNGKLEIYSVNMDGTAHHKKNRGYEVPKKEADELRSLGVSIPPDNIIENRQIDFTNIELDQILLLIE